AVRPMNPNGLKRLCRGAEPDNDPRIVCRSEAAIRARAAPALRPIAADDFRSGPEHIPPATAAHQPQADPMVPSANLVDQHQWRSVIVGHDDVNVAVVV